MKRSAAETVDEENDFFAFLELEIFFKFFDDSS